jgi:enolase-phosphatase E1
MTTRAILTDIEGTTGSISFVKDVLFPYARRKLPEFVRRHARERDVRRWLDAVAAEQGGMCDDAMVVEVLQGWIDADRKHTALKALQGMIWQDGYANADFAAHMYEDAAWKLREWHESGLPVNVYSSGSVPAQKMFFGHSTAGDLRPIVSDWFDTEVGGKREVPSYQRIAESIGMPAASILFLSDVVEELDAAREAGMATVLVDRREDYPEPRTGDAANGHPRVTSFADIALS